MYCHEFSCSLAHLLNSSVIHFKNGPEYLTRGTAQVSISFMRFLQCNLVSNSFLILLRYSFLIFFFYFGVFDSVHFQCSHIFVSFISSERSDFVLIGWLYSVRHLMFSTFHYSQVAFFYVKLHPYICISSSRVFGFPILFHSCKHLDVVHVHLVVDLLRFVKFVSACAFPKYVIE